MAIATNLDAEERDALSVLENVPFFELDNAECIAEFILSDYFRLRASYGHVARHRLG